DPGETRDMAEALPARFEALKAAYADYADRVGVIAPPDGFNPLEALRANTLARQRGGALPLMLGVILLLGVVGALLLWRRRSGR
ncbi:MAG: hypothetical protein AAGE43_16300, partial [Pseudomonadota bacterium]